MNWLRFSLVVAVIFFIAYIIFAYAYKPWNLSAELLEHGPIPLDKLHTYPFMPAIMPNDTYTVSFYIYPVAGNRTGAVGGAADAMFSVFNWDQLFSLQLMPQVRAGNSGSQLSVSTVSGPAIMTLPPLLLQKWTYVSIIVEGRRIDIAYNGRIVGSKIFDSMLSNPKAGKLTSGNPNLVGNIAYVTAANRRMTTDELMVDYVSSSNTRGEPYIGGLPTIKNLFSCPAGSFCGKPRTPPSKASSAWYTPFN
jgi:hypothetical protein